MGMAYQPPKNNYKAKFFITHNAVTKYRDFCDSETRSFADEALARLLDERLDDALKQGRMTQITDAASPVEVTTIALVESRGGMRCYVVMRAYRSGNNVIIGPDGRSGLATVGVLAESTGSTNMINGAWKPANRPFEKALANVKIEPKPVVAAPVVHPIVEVTPKRASSAGKAYPAGSRSRDARAVRINWARNELMQRPFMKAGGPDGLNEMMKQRFGIGLDPSIVDELRAECQAARGYKPEPTKQGGYGDIAESVVFPPEPDRPTAKFVHAGGSVVVSNDANRIMVIAKRMSDASLAKVAARSARERAEAEAIHASERLEDARRAETEANQNAAAIMAEMIEAQS